MAHKIQFQQLKTQFWSKPGRDMSISSEQSPRYIITTWTKLTISLIEDSVCMSRAQSETDSKQQKKFFLDLHITQMYANI